MHLRLNATHNNLRLWFPRPSWSVYCFPWWHRHCRAVDNSNTSWRFDILHNPRLSLRLTCWPPRLTHRWIALEITADRTVPILHLDFLVQLVLNFSGCRMMGLWQLLKREFQSFTSCWRQHCWSGRLYKYIQTLNENKKKTWNVLNKTLSTLFSLWRYRPIS